MNIYTNVDVKNDRSSYIHIDINSGINIDINVYRKNNTAMYIYTWTKR